ncbi:hypothetical protein KJ765_01470 [Candidatus Micrarchaeota archaeon]|nr:hypothetical protein [Candidatus Micrarchaeota archaeon]
MGILEDITNTIVKYLSESIRRFAAFVFIVYAIGVIVGTKVTLTGNLEVERLAWMIPVLLALLSYVYVQFAIVAFLIFALFLILL